MFIISIVRRKETITMKRFTIFSSSSPKDWKISFYSWFRFNFHSLSLSFSLLFSWIQIIDKTSKRYNHYHGMDIILTFIDIIQHLHLHLHHLITILASNQPRTLICSALYRLLSHLVSLILEINRTLCPKKKLTITKNQRVTFVSSSF